MNQQKEHGSSNDQTIATQEPAETPAVSNSRRSLLAKGWVVPIVVGVSLPKSGFAMNISSDEEFPGS